MSDKVLFVDDEANVLSAITRQLRKKFDVHTGLGGEAALQVLKSEGPFAVVVSDMRMPGMDGVQFLQKVMESYPDSVRIMLTGNADQGTAVNAINSGSIFSFHNKPCPPNELEKAVDAGIRHHHLIAAERTLLERTLAGSVKLLVDILSILDPGAFGKSATLQERSRAIAKTLGLTNTWELNIAVMMSTIGQIALPAEITTKMQEGRELSESEQALVERVPETGRNLIANIPRLEKIGEIIYYQAKGFDGSGFPDDEVSGEDILVEARILRALNDLAKAETLEGATEAAFTKLETYASQYDPAVLDAVRSEILGESGDASDNASSKPFEVATHLLRPGDRLTSDIKTVDGTLLLAAGTEISQMEIERIRNKRSVVEIDETVHVVRAEAPTKKEAEETAADQPDQPS